MRSALDSSKLMKTPGSSNIIAPLTRKLVASSVLPQPGPPQIKVGRPAGSPPRVTASRPLMPVGAFGREDNAVAVILLLYPSSCEKWLAHVRARGPRPVAGE